MATTAEIQTSTAAMVAGIAGFTTVALRRIASSEYGIKGMSSARKSDLLAAIHIAAAQREEEAQTSHGRHEREDHEFNGVTAGCPECEAKVAADRKRETAEIVDYAKQVAQDKIDAAADAKLNEEAEALAAKIDAGNANAKPARKSTKCQVCQSAKIDRKTQGRDSTMCEPCYDYAGWENTHSDDNHEEVGADADCPVCAKTSDAQPATEVTEIKNPKAARFAADAVAAGWKIASATVSGETTTLTVLGGGEWIQICWNGTQFDYLATSHKNAKGKVLKVRNASAARKILAA